MAGHIKRGNPARWLTPDGLEAIRGWARRGCNYKEVAHNMGIAVSTLSNWRQRYPEIENALQESREVADIIIENALFAKARKGNIAAIIFWLKNRMPDRWRDRYEHNTPQDQLEQDARIAKLLLENEKIKTEIERLADAATPTPDDGFLDALNESAADDWGNGDEEPS